MKRLLLILIVLFPAVTLAVWVFYGMSLQHRGTPAPPTETNITTNLNASTNGK